MVRDVRPEAGYEWGPFEWDEYVELGDSVYFAADDGVHGREPWRWQPGRPPVMLKDLCPGACGSKPSHFALFDGKVFFVADDGTHGKEPWRTDGSVGGTRLLADILPGGPSSNPDFPVALGTSIYFAAGGGGSDDRELWKTDGTAAGTERLLDIEPGPVGSRPVSLTVLDDKLYFTARTTATGRELWESDGTPSGTALVVEHCPGDCDGFWEEQWSPFGDSRVLQEFAGRLLVLTGALGGPFELHVLQNAPSELVLLKSGVAWILGPFPGVGNRFFFEGCEQSVDCELWSSDGTPAGTALVADIRPGAEGSNLTFIGALGSELLFFADDGSSGQELWKSDGTEPGTMLLADIAAGAASSAPFLDRFPGLRINGRMVFRADDGIHGDEFWTTDGTAGGTKLLVDIWPGPVTSQAWGGFGDRIVVGSDGLFSANNLAVGFATWATDGTPAGTRLFLDSNWQGSAIELEALLGTPRLQAGALGDRLLFGADDGASGEELWITDGTAGGTGLVADLEPGEAVPGLPLGSNPHRFLDGGGVGLVGAGGASWATDGTTAGTVELSSGSVQGPFLPRPGGQPGGFYVQINPENGSELVATDGTAAGTVVLVPGAKGAPAILGESLLLFRRDTSASGEELWAYPLPSGPPVLVEDIYPGGESSWPEILGELGGEILFAATDPAVGRELWATDGTAAGTRLVRDIASGPMGSSPVVPTSEHPAPITSRGLFFVADDGQAGAELWVTDGTERGTELIADLWPGAVSSSPDHAVVAGDRVFFIADDGVHGRELWVTMDRAARLVRDIRPGPESSVPGRYAIRRLVELGGRVLFGATDGVRGMELWVSDGSVAGTWLVQDIHSGRGSSSPTGFVTAGSRIYFAATNGVDGFELWSLPLDFEIFADGFESGDASAWSSTVP